MRRQFVEFSMIRSIGYDAPTATLEIEFKSSGAIWRYSDFPERLYKEFQASNSLGRFFHSRIKDEFSEYQSR